MARAELKLNLDVLKRLENKFKSPELEAKLQGVASMKEVAGLVAQAIADNFAREGPGWTPLKGATIRNSVAQNRATKLLIKDAYMAAAHKVGAVRVSKSGKRSIDREALRGRRKNFYKHVDQFIENVERAARQGMPDDESIGNRQILKRTGLLMKTVTTPGYGGSNGKISGQNIYQVQGSNLIWGTNLIYAATHNYGRDKIPKREFLVIRDEWQARLTRFVFKLMADIVKQHVEGQ